MSALNCKPGDLAIVVKSRAGNEGKIVRVIRMATQEESNKVDPAWLIDRPLSQVWRGSGLPRPAAPYCHDHVLRPIRPLDELDDITRDEEVTA